MQTFYRGGIVGPRAVIKAEVIDSREWQEVISTDGVNTYVAQLRKRALVEETATGGRPPVNHVPPAEAARTQIGK